MTDRKLKPLKPGESLYPGYLKAFWCYITSVACNGVAGLLYTLCLIPEPGSSYGTPDPILDLDNIYGLIIILVMVGIPCYFGYVYLKLKYTFRD